ncbi:hypothetical protein ACFPIF_10340 [Brevundimonas faecalis]|uniref:hypothetical protein n=1 Tax=Brevundimonas faecalis TaxID=947378 RepID=UPI00361D9296
MNRSLVDILINALRTQSAAVLQFEQLRAAGVDEFTLARARRSMIDVAHGAAAMADNAEAINRAAWAALPASILTASAMDHDDPPSDPPPQAA